MRKERILPIVVGLLLAAVSTAQDRSKYYTNQHPEEFLPLDWIAFYDEIDAGTAATRKELPHHLDLAFGNDPKQKLDLYLPKEKAEAAPTFLFLHGGGMREGDRAHYGYIARPFAANGIITAVASYRLAIDGFQYPAQPEDVAAAVAWIHKHVEEYGGDPQRIYVGGHSAGAILSAYLGVQGAWRQKKGIPDGVLKGIAPVSAPYHSEDAETEAEIETARVVRRAGAVGAYVPDPELRVEASVDIDNPPPRAVVAVGSVEAYVDSSREFADKLKARGVEAEFVVLEGEDHAQTALSLGDEDSELFRAVLKMIQAP